MPSYPTYLQSSFTFISNLFSHFMPQPPKYTLKWAWTSSAGWTGLTPVLKLKETPRRAPVGEIVALKHLLVLSYQDVNSSNLVDALTHFALKNISITLSNDFDKNNFDELEHVFKQLDLIQIHAQLNGVDKESVKINFAQMIANIQSLQYIVINSLDLSDIASMCEQILTLPTLIEMNIGAPTMHIRLSRISSHIVLEIKGQCLNAAHEEIIHRLLNLIAESAVSSTLSLNYVAAIDPDRIIKILAKDESTPNWTLTALEVQMEHPAEAFLKSITDAIIASKLQRFIYLAKNVAKSEWQQFFDKLALSNNSALETVDLHGMENNFPFWQIFAPYVSANARDARKSHQCLKLR